MATNRPAAANEPGAADTPPPTAAAELRITAERVKGLSMLGTVPPADARYLITTFGIMWCVAAGTAGAAITYRAAPYVAFGALALGFAGIVLIAVCGRVRRQTHAAGPGAATGTATAARVPAVPALEDCPGEQLAGEKVRSSDRG